MHAGRYNNESATLDKEKLEKEIKGRFYKVANFSAFSLKITPILNTKAQELGYVTKTQKRCSLQNA